MPVPSWKTRAAEGTFQASGKHDCITTSNVLRRLHVLLHLVVVIPRVPRNFPKFHNERGGPSFAGVSSAEPEEVSFLSSGPFDSNASLEESESSNAVLRIDCLEKAWHAGLGA